MVLFANELILDDREQLEAINEKLEKEQTLNPVELNHLSKPAN